MLTHSCTVEDGPQATPDSEGGPADNREADVVGSPYPAGRADEASRDSVAYPHAQP